MSKYSVRPFFSSPPPKPVTGTHTPLEDAAVKIRMSMEEKVGAQYILIGQWIKPRIKLNKCHSL